MTVDLVQLFVLLVFVVVAFVSALYVVEPSWSGSDEIDRAARVPACDDFYILGGSWNNWAKLAFVVLNAVVDGRAQDALFMCVLHEENENRYLLWVFTYLVLLFVVVLLLNMLIAMFSRSFDLMYDSMAIHLQTHFARAVVAWCASTPEPPPLNLLQVPYKVVRLLLTPRVSAGPASAPHTSPGTFSGLGLQPAVHWLLYNDAGGGRVAARDYKGTTQPRQGKARHSKASPDYDGTTVKSVEGVRNSWEIWKEKVL